MSDNLTLNLKTESGFSYSMTLDGQGNLIDVSNVRIAINLKAGKTIVGSHYVYWDELLKNHSLTDKELEKDIHKKTAIKLYESMIAELQKELKALKS